MRDFIYDLKRTFTGKFTIVVIVFIILISVGIGYAFIAGGGSSSSGTSISVNDSYTYNNATGTFNVTFYAFDQYGTPAPTVPIYTEHNGTYWTNETASDGFLNISFAATGTNGFAKGFELLNYSLTPFNSTSHGLLHQLGMSAAPSTTPTVYLNIISKPGTTTSKELMIYYASSNTSQQQSTYVYYKVVNLTSGFTSNNFNPTNMTYYAALKTNGVGIKIVDINPSSRGVAQAVVVGAFNGTTASSLQMTLTEYEPSTAVSTIGIAKLSFDIFAGVFGLLIPLFASLSAYFYFGKDRASGVLESVITRPVTKGRIIMSRYTANLGSLIIAFAVGTGLFEIFLKMGTGSYMTASYAGSLIWTYFVEIAAFTGIIYLVSQFLKSQGAILGVIIALFFVFAVLWSGLLEPLILNHVFHVIAGTNIYEQYSIILSALNPAGYPSLVTSYIAQVNAFGTTFNPALFGITQASLAAIGLIWIIVPILIAFVIGRRRD